MTIAEYLRGRAAAFKLDAEECDKKVDDGVKGEPPRELQARAMAYRMAAVELLNLADQIRDDGYGAAS